MRRESLLILLLLILGSAGLYSCRPATSAAVFLTPTAEPATPTTVVFPTPTNTPFSTEPSTALPPTPTATILPTPRPSATPTITPTATPIGLCTQRVPRDNLLTLVTLEYGLSRHYEPADLVPLSDYLPPEVTLGYPTQVRGVIVEPLTHMIQAMQADGLQPFIISGYRSYAAQAIAREKWLEREPDRANILSAPPGYSEHQLGTTIDFGSPELAEIVGDEEIEFHTYFYKTGEGEWLAQNAHRYGFTLSYPRDAFELTGFFYEPWHYRYVGEALATALHESNMTLTAYLLATQPVPCIP